MSPHFPRGKLSATKHNFVFVVPNLKWPKFLTLRDEKKIDSRWRMCTMIPVPSLQLSEV